MQARTSNEEVLEANNSILKSLGVGMEMTNDAAKWETQGTVLFGPPKWCRNLIGLVPCQFWCGERAGGDKPPPMMKAKLCWFWLLFGTRLDRKSFAQCRFPWLRQLTAGWEGRQWQCIASSHSIHSFIASILGRKREELAIITSVCRIDGGNGGK